MARPAGSPNKSKQRLLKSLQAEYGAEFDPVLKMAANCARLQSLVDARWAEGASDPDIDLTLLLQTNKEWDRVARYVTPQLKSVELTPSFDDSDCSDTSWTIKVVGVTEK